MSRNGGKGTFVVGMASSLGAVTTRSWMPNWLLMVTSLAGSGFVLRVGSGLVFEIGYRVRWFSNSVMGVITPPWIFVTGLQNQRAFSTITSGSTPNWSVSVTVVGCSSVASVAP